MSSPLLVPFSLRSRTRHNPAASCPNSGRTTESVNPQGKGNQDHHVHKDKLKKERLLYQPNLASEKRTLM